MKPSTGPLGPQPPADLPPDDEPPAPPPEARPGGWRPVPQRGFRRLRKKSEGRPAGPVVEAAPPPPPPTAPPPERAQTTSWATWQRKYTPKLFLLYILTNTCE